MFTAIRQLIPMVALCLFALPTLGNAQEMEGPKAGSEMFVRVTQNREISGELQNIEQIKVTTGFGPVDIPVEKINGIKLHVDGNDSSVIAFKNGDLVTGKVSLKVVELKTEWGVAHVNTEQIQEISAIQGGGFVPSASGSNKGWRFSSTSRTR